MIAQIAHQGEKIEYFHDEAPEEPLVESMINAYICNVGVFLDWDCPDDISTLIRVLLSITGPFFVNLHKNEQAKDGETGDFVDEQKH